MTVQSTFGRPAAVNPKAKKLKVTSIEATSIHSVEPIESSVKYPDDAILLSLKLSQRIAEEQVVAHPPVSGEGNQTLLILHPEDAHKLSRQLQQILLLERDASNEGLVD